METSVTERYQDAVDTLCRQLKKDRYVIAVILAGSMAYDIVWDKSDLDICIITGYEKQKYSYKNLVENGIPIYAEVFSRNAFKKQLQQAVQGSHHHSFFMKGKILFTKDASFSGQREDIRSN